MKKIITHDGLFHADEVFTIALLHVLLGKVPVERTRSISSEDINDPDIWIVDVGGVCQPSLHNFDHHQYASSPASNILVLDHLLSRQVITDSLYDELYDAFFAISEIDCNGSDNMNGFQVSSLIKSFNYRPNGWDTALSIASEYIESCIDSVSKAVESRSIWDRAEDVSFGVKLVDSFPIHWKRYNEAHFIICPDKDKWKLLSCNSNDYPIHPTGTEEFIHNGKFIAVYSNKEDALDSARFQSTVLFA